MKSALKLNNKQVRRLWLEANLLAKTPNGPLDLMGIISQLGFVQLDTIRVIERAHHHILWSRNQNYRSDMFDPLLAKDRAVFEHFTHDASVIDMAIFPFWQRQFQRKKAQIARGNWYKAMPDEKARAKMRARIAREGALSTHAFESETPKSDAVWAKPPHKQALDYMWLTGDLATCFRENFTKYYNLPERVIPQHLREEKLTDEAQVEGLCARAIDRLGIGSPKEIAHFWDAVSIAEARDWVKDADLARVQIEDHEGNWHDAYASPDIEARLENLGPPSARLRVLNPFDPAIRDRDRLKRLFGMDYKIEIFVPKAKRKYGYYIYPLLEGDRMVGRIEVEIDRAKGLFRLAQIWPEAGVTWSAKRAEKLNAELARMGRFISVPFSS